MIRLPWCRAVNRRLAPHHHVAGLSDGLIPFGAIKFIPKKSVHLGVGHVQVLLKAVDQAVSDVVGHRQVELVAAAYDAEAAVALPGDEVRGRRGRR
jgi:hypothetical protein